MVDMDARYLYAIAIGIVAGILLNVAYVVTAAIDIISLFILPIIPLGLGLIEAVVLFLFLAGIGAFTAGLVRRRYGDEGVKTPAVAGLIAGIVGNFVSLLVGLIIAVIAAVIGLVSGYYIVGGEHPWLGGAALGVGGFVLASIYTVLQYVVFCFVFMVLAALGGFLYNHFARLNATKNV